MTTRTKETWDPQAIADAFAEAFGLATKARQALADAPTQGAPQYVTQMQEKLTFQMREALTDIERMGRELEARARGEVAPNEDWYLQRTSDTSALYHIVTRETGTARCGAEVSGPSVPAGLASSFTVCPKCQAGKRMKKAKAVEAVPTASAAQPEDTSLPLGYGPFRLRKWMEVNGVRHVKGETTYGTLGECFDALHVDPDKRPHHGRWRRLGKKLRDQIVPAK